MIFAILLVIELVIIVTKFFFVLFVTSLYPHYCGYIRLIRTLSVIVTHKTKGVTIRYFKIFVITFFLHSSSLAQIVSDG